MIHGPDTSNNITNSPVGRLKVDFFSAFGSRSVSQVASVVQVVVSELVFGSEVGLVSVGVDTSSGSDGSWYSGA